MNQADKEAAILDYLHDILVAGKIDCISINVRQMATDIAGIIRNHQPEPTQKQVDEEKIIELMARKMEPMTFTVFDQVESGEYKPAPGYNEILSKIQECREYSLAAFSAFRPYLRQVDNGGGEAEGLEADLNELIRVAITNPNDLQGFIQANYPSHWAKFSVQNVSEPQQGRGDVIETAKAVILEARSNKSMNGWLVPDFRIENLAKALDAALQTPQPTVEPKGESGEEGIFYRKLMIDDGRVYWLYPDNSHRGLTKADVHVINRLRVGDEFKLLPSQTEADSSPATVDNAELEKVREHKYLSEWHDVTQHMMGSVGLYLQRGDLEKCRERFSYYRAKLPKFPTVDKLLGKTINDMEGGE